jgi:hypothetical protein
MPYTNSYTVNWAYYGTTTTSTPGTSAYNDVTSALQTLLNSTTTGLITINNTNFGPDPSPGNAKAFCASVTLCGTCTPIIYIVNSSLGEGEQLQF